MHARSRAHDEPRRDRHRALAMEWARICIRRKLQGSNDLLLGRRSLRARRAVRELADQAGADRMGRADLRDRRHQDAADRAGVAIRRCAAQGWPDPAARQSRARHLRRSEEHTSELQSLMRISYAVFCLKKKNTDTNK